MLFQVEWAVYYRDILSTFRKEMKLLVKQSKIYKMKLYMKQKKDIQFCYLVPLSF